MTILRIEHRVLDFETWKANFDRFDDFRVASRVRGYQVLRPVADARYVIVDLEFEAASHAEAMLEAMRDHWRGLQGTVVPENTAPHTLVADIVAAKQY